MVLAHGVKQIIDKWLDKKDQEFRDKGRAENQQAWIEWNTRRLDAQSRGQPFTEPPPNGNID